jgi:hypothetical protein
LWKHTACIVWRKREAGGSTYPQLLVTIYQTTELHHPQDEHPSANNQNALLKANYTPNKSRQPY